MAGSLQAPSVKQCELVSALNSLQPNFLRNGTGNSA
jgi:hypothetical protein